MKVIEIDIATLTGGYDSYENDCLWIAVPDDHKIIVNDKSCIRAIEISAKDTDEGVDMYVIPTTSRITQEG